SSVEMARPLNCCLLPDRLLAHATRSFPWPSETIEQSLSASDPSLLLTSEGLLHASDIESHELGNAGAGAHALPSARCPPVPGPSSVFGDEHFSSTTKQKLPCVQSMSRLHCAPEPPPNVPGGCASKAMASVGAHEGPASGALSGASSTPASFARTSELS